MFRSLTPSQLAIDVIIPTVGVLLVLGTGGDYLLFTSILTALGMGTAMAFRRMSPPIALIVAWLTAAFQMLSGLSPEPSNLAILPILFASAAYGTATVKWIGLASSFWGAFVVALYLITLPAVRGYDLTEFFLIGIVDLWVAGGLAMIVVNTAGAFIAALAVFMLSWVLGLLARSYSTTAESRKAQARAESLQEKARQDVMVEQERTRIARDMHDVVAHSLAVVIAQADGARYARVLDPSAVDGALETISSTAREALGDVRILLGQLRHSEIEAPQPVLDDLDRLLDQMRGSGLVIRYIVHGERTSLARSQQLALFRIVQEALTNVLRHGDTTQEVDVMLRWDDENVAISIASGYVGQVSQPLRPGHGLSGMRERATLVGGWLTADVVGDRFLVSGSVPRVPGQTGVVAAITTSGALR